MVLLDNDTFLTELTRLFIKSKTKGTGSVYVTMKRYDGKVAPDPKPDSSPPKKIATLKKAAAAKRLTREPAKVGCIVRAKLQKKKIATVVPLNDVPKFQLAYCSCLRGNMDALKKIRKTRNKAKNTS